MTRGGLIWVGAWEGLEFREADGRRLLLFEPQARPFAQLEQAFAGRPDVTLVNAAAGARQGSATIYRVWPDHSSSLLAPEWLRSGFRRDGEETVRMNTVDSEVHALGLTGMFESMGIDTQGYELEVLKGAVRTLKDLREVDVELHDGNTYPGAAPLDALDEFMAARGFERTRLDREGSDDWGDVHYERNAAQDGASTRSLHAASRRCAAHMGGGAA